MSFFGDGLDEICPERNRPCVKHADSLDKIENDLNECLETFERLIDQTLDAYNDELISKEMMENWMKDGQTQVDRTLKSIEEVKNIRNKKER